MFRVPLPPTGGCADDTAEQFLWLVDRPLGFARVSNYKMSENPDFRDKFVNRFLNVYGNLIPSVADAESVGNLVSPPNQVTRTWEVL